MDLCIPPPCLPIGWEPARPQSEAHDFLSTRLDLGRAWSLDTPPPALGVDHTRALFGGWAWDTRCGCAGVFFKDQTAVLAHRDQGVVCPWPVQRTPDAARAQTLEGGALAATLEALDTPGALFPWTGFKGRPTPALVAAARAVGDDLILLVVDRAHALGFAHIETTWDLDGASVGRHGELLPPVLSVGVLWGGAGDVDGLVRWLQTLHTWTASTVDPTLPVDTTCIAQNLTYAIDTGAAAGHGMMGPQTLWDSGYVPATTNAHQTLPARHRLTARFGPLPV